MADFNWKKFYEERAEFARKQIEWYTHEIEWCTYNLERTRKEDREMVEWVWSKGVVTEREMEIYNSKYQSTETHKLLLERRRHYLKRKGYAKDLTWCRTRLEELNK